jgi:DNA (cytosine-5)-methyltransferase 1
MARARPRRITGPWRLTDLPNMPKNGLTAFSCFHCGGGSTMGYKLAGFQVLGGVEIDPKMMSIYRANHKPKHSYLMGVQQFNELPLDKVPDELKRLDVLDGSPPCSVFSMAGKREKKWGSEHHFREGQQKQRLDDLFMHFIEVGQRLQPKVIVAENVKGLILGNAKGYVKEIFAAFREAGYDAQLFLFNAARMGVPQARERTFFIARRRDLGWKPLKMAFDEPVVSLRQAWQDLSKQQGDPLPPCYQKVWVKIPPGKTGKDYGASSFQVHKINQAQPARTATAQSWHTLHDTEPRNLSALELTRIQSFPDDYNFSKLSAKFAGYVMGMSVPPFMTQRVALEIGRQWFGVEYE